MGRKNRLHLPYVAVVGSQGLFRGVADNAMRLGICSRSNDVIEPMIKPQW